MPKYVPFMWLYITIKISIQKTLIVILGKKITCLAIYFELHDIKKYFKQILYQIILLKDRFGLYS